MTQVEHNQAIENKDEISVEEIVKKFKLAISDLKKKWLLILLFAIMGACAGMGYSLLKKPLYSAYCTFVLEDNNKSGGLSQFAGLASLTGIDVAGSNGLFQGDNIIELYKSRQMIEKTLLCLDTFNNKPQLLIDRYVEFNKLKKKWNNDDDIDEISFKGNPTNFSRKQDSLITDIVDLFNRKYLFVSKPDKKLSIIKVQADSKDEFFAKAFVNKLVENVNDFYVRTKTKKALQNVEVLEFQADSVRRILNSSISGVASAIDAAPNANPLLLSLRVPSQRKQVDVQASTAVYAEIVKNLELSKVSLRQEKPLIQIIDQPVLPLYVDKVTKKEGLIFGALLAALTASCFIIIRRIFSTTN